MTDNQKPRRPLTCPLARSCMAVLAGTLLVASAAGCDRSGKAGAAESRQSDEKRGAADGGRGTESAQKDESHADEVKLAEDAVRKYGIKLDKATRRVLQPTILAPARVSFNMEQTSHVGVPVMGRVVELVRLGDLVKKGDVLLAVDSPEFGEAQSEYLQKRTTLAIAGPAVEVAQTLYESGQALLQESQGISKTEVLKRQAELQAAKGALKTAEGAVVAAENKLRVLGMSQEAIDALAKSMQVNARYEVRASISGQVVERDVTLGELVRPERESLLVLANLSTLWVIADVPQTSLHEVALGSRARVTVGTGPGAAAAEGRVSYIDPQLDRETLRARVRIEFKAEGTGLQAGMFAQAEIDATMTGQPPAPVLAVPEEAVQTVEGSTAVFVPVPGEPNTFAKRAIKVGARVGGWTPVTSGLEEGEEVVVANSFILKAELGKSSAEHED